MPWSATSRYGLVPAPGALGLVQDLLNTAQALYEGQHAGTGHRLKTCRNPRCRVAFYDRSRNASGVWHSVRVCGNAINLRAHRERRRAAV
jgi:predicted RNA-binding Zn ribbon-like protein